MGLLPSANDLDHSGGEPCLAVRQPRLHGAWRALVSRWRLLWVVRVFGPGLFVRLSGRQAAAQPEGTLCIRRPSSAGRTSSWRPRADSGARVIATAPIVPSGSAERLERRPTHRQALAAARGTLPGRVLACALQEGCSYPELLMREADFTTIRWEAPGVPRPVATLGAAWRRAAQDHGGAFIDFMGVLRSLSPAGVVGPRYLADSIHLTPDGTWVLAGQWAAAIASQEGVPTPADTSVPEATMQRYIESFGRRDYASEWLSMTRHQRCLGEYLAVADALQSMQRLVPDPEATLLQGWRPGLAGLDAALPPDLEARRAQLDERPLCAARVEPQPVAPPAPR